MTESLAVAELDVSDVAIAVAALSWSSKKLVTIEVIAALICVFCSAFWGSIDLITSIALEADEVVTVPVETEVNALIASLVDGLRTVTFVTDSVNASRVSYTTALTSNC